MDRRSADRLGGVAGILDYDTDAPWVRTPPRTESRRETVPVVSNDQLSRLAGAVADAMERRPVSLAVGGRDLAQSIVNDNSRTIREHDMRVRKGYGGK